MANNRFVIFLPLQANIIFEGSPYQCEAEHFHVGLCGLFDKYANENSIYQVDENSNNYHKYLLHIAASDGGKYQNFKQCLTIISDMKSVLFIKSWPFTLGAEELSFAQSLKHIICKSGYKKT